MIRLEKDDPSTINDRSAIRLISSSLHAMEMELGKFSSAREAIDRTNKANHDIANNILKYYEELIAINKTYSDVIKEYEKNRMLAANLVGKEAETYANQIRRLGTLSDNVVDHVAERTETAIRGLIDAIDTIGTMLTDMGTKVSDASDGIESKIESIKPRLTALSDDIRRGTTIDEIQKLTMSVQALTGHVDRHGCIAEHLEKRLGHMDLLTERVNAIHETAMGLHDGMDRLLRERLRMIGQALEGICPTIRHTESLLQDMHDGQRRQERSITALLEDNARLDKELRDQKACNEHLLEIMSAFRNRLDQTDRKNDQLAELVQECSSLVEERLPKKKKWFF